MQLRLNLLLGHVPSAFPVDSLLTHTHFLSRPSPPPPAIGPATVAPCATNVRPVPHPPVLGAARKQDPGPVRPRAAAQVLLCASQEARDVSLGRLGSALNTSRQVLVGAAPAPGDPAPPPGDFLTLCRAPALTLGVYSRLPR